jgi:hypothetical protein
MRSLRRPSSSEDGPFTVHSALNQLPLLNIPAPTIREYVKDRLCGFTARQRARDISRAEKRRRRKRIAAQPPRRAQQEMLAGMRQLTLFDMEPTEETA